MFTVVLVSLVAYALGNCVSYDKKDYTCSSLYGNYWSFYRNFDSKKSAYWSNYLRVNYAVNRVIVDMPYDESYIFDLIGGVSACTQSKVDEVTKSSCPVPRWVDGALDYSTTITVELEKENGGRRGYRVISTDYVWLGTTIKLPPSLVHPDASVTVETISFRNFPSRFFDFLNLNVNNLTYSTLRQSLESKNNKNRATTFVNMNGLTDWSLEAVDAVTTDDPETKKPLSAWVEAPDDVRISFWMVRGNVPSRAYAYYKFQGSEESQTLRHVVKMRLGMWRSGWVNMLALFVSAVCLSVLGVCLILGLIVFCCCFARRKRLAAVREQQVIVVQGQHKDAVQNVVAMV
eukprot:Platyproteum_vivax@DN301_c0_g1_i1.p1